MNNLGYKKDATKIILDCANGVGGLFTKEILETMSEWFDITPVNTNDINNLNKNCGAEYAHKS